MGMLLLALAYLNDQLSTKTFLNGERPSIADCAVVASLSLAFKQVLAPEYRKNVPHVTRWFQTCVHKMSAFGAHKLCEKEAQFDSKTFGALNKKDGKQAGKAKKEQPKKQEKAKPKAEPKPVEKKPEKPKDPFSVMPGAYDMDAWKRCYSNEDTLPTAMKYFWEKMGKLSFAFMCYFGGQEKGDIEISGVWFWKGHELAFDLCEDWQTDYEQYDWTKLDTTNAEHRQKIENYMSWEGKFENNKPLINGVIWK